MAICATFGVVPLDRDQQATYQKALPESPRVIGMFVKHLRLRHFRIYDSLDLPLSTGVTLLYGPNGAGKTNVLEAIFVLATTKSFRTRTDREVVSWHAAEEGVPRYARLEGDAEVTGGPTRVDMVIAEQTPRAAGQDPGVRKQFKLNGTPKRAADVVGTIKAVLFSPDDLSLVTGSPSHRRRYLDLMLCQIDHRYLRRLQEYARILAQRNALLQRLRGRPDPATLLEYWDDALIGAGTDIMTMRISTLRLLNDFAREAYADLTDNREDLAIAYKPSLEDAGTTAIIQLPGMFRHRLEQLQSKEIYQGVTLCGPHRDDLQFSIDGADAQAYGSRGQQRSVALALRLAELHYMTNRTGEQPVLLLDEVLAELDDDRRELLLRLVQAQPQVLITTSNLEAFPIEFRERATLLAVDSGRISIQSPTRAPVG